MDLRKLKKLIDLVEESGVARIEVIEGEEKVHVTRATAAQPVFATPATITPVAAAPVAAAPAPAVSAALAVRDLSSAQKSPMVGTSYRASGPDIPAFVEIGQQVKAGDTLCIIETMELMSEIGARKSGVIKEILVDNGTPVEYDEPLFIIG